MEIHLPAEDGFRYVWDKRPGYFFIEWWEGRKRKRELAGRTPSEATEAQRRKQNELIGELLATARNFRNRKKALPHPYRMPLPYSPITCVSTPPTNLKPCSAMRRSWSTSSGILAAAATSKRSPGPTSTTTRSNGRARRANNTLAQLPRGRSTSKSASFAPFLLRHQRARYPDGESLCPFQTPQGPAA